MNSIIAFDPGLATGVAIYNSYTHQHHSFQVDNGFDGVAYLLSGEQDRDAFLPDNPSYLESFSAVVCESFRVRPNTHKMDQGAFLTVWSNIGAIRYAAYLADVPFHFQSPAEAKSFGTDAKLRQLGWWKGGAGHADDASRHLLTFLVKNRDPYVLDALA